MSNLQSIGSKASGIHGGVKANQQISRVPTSITKQQMISKGIRYVLVVENYVTNFVNLYVLHNQTVRSVVHCLFDDNYVPLQGMRETQSCDQGRQIVSEIVRRQY